MPKVIASTDRQAPGPDGGHSYRSAVHALSSAQKTAKGAPGYSRFVNRRIGRYLAAAAYLLGLTPNQVTAVSALFSAAGIAVTALVHPAPLAGVAITVLLLLGYALDSADGQLARLRSMSSSSGEWLDHMVDCAKIATMHLAVLVGLYRFGSGHETAYLLVPLGFSVVTSVLFFGMTLNDQLRRARTGGRPSPPAGASALRSIAVIPTDFGVVCAVFLAWGWPAVFTVLYALLFLAHVGFLALAAVKWFHDMRALDGVG